MEDSSKAKTLETIDEDDLLWAKEQLILERATHLDSLVHKLREKRVRRVIEPILAGNYLPLDSLDDDQMYVRDLGLIVSTPQMTIANSIYREIIPRALNSLAQDSIPNEYTTWLTPNGLLNWERTWDNFLEFWRADHS